MSKGTAEVKQGDRGVDVTKVQQALIDLGYLLPKYGVDGIFEDETRAAVLKFQKDQGLAETGKLDKDTLARLDDIYDTRKPYIDAAKHDPANPGTRTLSAADKAAATDAMVAKPGAGGTPTVFTRVTSNGKDKAKEENRVQMWGLFQTCIHEYIHTLAHPDYQTWAQSFANKGDDTRYNTLIEGFCDFFTLNVRKAMTIDAAIDAQVEGPYANGNPPAPDVSGVYPSHAQAEQVVSIVGIKNAQAGYFGGNTRLMGTP